MKLRIIILLFFTAASIFSMSPAKAVRTTIRLPSSPKENEPLHIPYNPFKQLKTLPEYPYGNPLPNPPSMSPLSKPTGIDLDVTYISRTPMYNRYEVLYTGDGRPYLRPGTENFKRWPTQGEIVTFTAHIINKGTQPSGNFTFKWYVDNIEVNSGTQSSLAPGEEGTMIYQWAWAHSFEGERLLGSHSIRFEVDPSNLIAETYESNNNLEDRTDALSLVLAVTPDLYQALETPIDPQWPYSAEDWLQKQILAMNAAFVRSNYSSAPNGIVERVRLNKILITSNAPPTDWTEDGGFFVSQDDRFGNAYYDPETDVSGALIHELTHQLGIIDMYGLDVPLEVPQVLDRMGRPVQIEYQSYFLFPGLMNNPGIKPPIYDEHTTLALNTNKGFRRGYYGEYLYDVPEQTYLHILDNQGNPALGVTVKLYQRSSDQGLYGGRFGTIDNAPEITGVTDNTGVVLLTNRSVGTPTTTNTGHTLQDNPFAVIDVVGRNDLFILEITKGTHQEHRWLDITQFNFKVWRGLSNTIEIYSHVPPGGAPDTVSLSGFQESGLVRLQWTSGSSDSIAGYNIYRASTPAFEYQRIVTNTTTSSYSDTYNYSERFAAYAVTAVNTQGQESGFSNSFYALRLTNPAAIVIAENNNRIVLDPQNGYALLHQLLDGTFEDTRSSYDYHLEYSKYLARDWSNRLLISHPGDDYSAPHSIRVFDQNFNLVFEFGQTGSGTGQFQGPAGVAIWGQPCSTNTCRYLVSDSGNNRIQAFDTSGNFISAYGTIGNGNGQFNNPLGLTVTNNGKVIVVDSNNNRLQVLRFDGTDFEFDKHIRAGFLTPTGITAFGTNYIVVADTGNNKIKVLDHEGVLLDEYDNAGGNTGVFAQPRGVAADSSGNIVVADTGNQRVVTIYDALPDLAPPDAINDAFNINEDTFLNFTEAELMANDSNPDGGTLTVSAIDSNSMEGGTITYLGNHKYQYSPPENFYGTDTFTYTVLDGNGSEDTATVTVTVDPVNDGPAAVDDELTTDEDTAVEFSTSLLLANDSDPDSDVLTILKVDAISTEGGTIKDIGGGYYLYTPLADFFGEDIFTYDVTDGTETETATVTVTVNQVEDVIENFLYMPLVNRSQDNY